MERNINHFAKVESVWKLKPIEGFRFLRNGFYASPSLTIPANTASAHRLCTLKRQ
jgi:hypothetical protein